MSDKSPPSITKHALRMRELMDSKDDLEAKLKAVNSELRDLKEKELPRLMENAEVEKVTIAGAGSLYIKQETYVSMVKDPDAPEDEAPFYDYARQNAPDLIQPYIHPARLKSWVKDRLENGLSVPDNTLKVTHIPTATLRRSK